MGGASDNHEDELETPLGPCHNKAMKKLLLIYEDYSESSRFQAILKKIGFDANVINSPQRLGDQILTINPDIVIVHGTLKFTSMGVGQKLKEINFFKGKTVVILPNGERPQPAELAKARVDVLMEAPIDPARLIEVLAKLGQMEVAPLLEKFRKANFHENPNNTAAVALKRVTMERERSLVRGEASHYSEEILIEDKARTDRYQQFIKDIHIDTKQSSHNKQSIKARQSELKKDWDFKFLEELDKLKRQFAAALFRK